jgi:RNA polymerase sigma-70 factor (ECF subfamily)
MQSAHDVVSVGPAPRWAEREVDLGGDDSFAAELDAHRSALRAYASILSHSAVDADDLVQDTLLRAWRYRSSFVAGTNLKAWLRRILRNEFLTSVAQLRPVEDVDGKFAARLMAPETSEWSSRVGETLAAIDRLPSLSRQALLLVAEGASYEEMAAIWGCGVGSVKGRVSRARQRLIKMLDGADPRDAAGSLG